MADRPVRIAVSPNEGDPVEDVTRLNPFPVEVLGPISAGGLSKEIVVDPIPGVGVGAAYTAGDAFGGAFVLQGAARGVGKVCALATSLFLDRSDQGAAMQLAIFNAPFTATADNAAFAVTDADLSNRRAIVKFAAADYLDWSANQACQGDKGQYIAGGPGGDLYCQFITTGTPTVAASNLPGLVLVFAQDV